MSAEASTPVPSEAILSSSPAIVPSVQVAVRNLATVLTDAQVQQVLPSLQKMIDHDFAPIWGRRCHLVFYPKTAVAPSNAWLLGIFDDADQAGALGYHDVTGHGLPIAKVFAKTTMQYGGQWTVTAAHELQEMLGDPWINQVATDERHGREYAYETSDAVEDDRLGYVVDGVLVSDFVTPHWFITGPVPLGAKFAFKSPVTAPLQILPGGYIGVRENGGEWTQITADAGPIDAGSTGLQQTVPIDARTARLHDHPPRHDQRAAVGSRRERRRTPKAHWRHSTAH